MNDVQITRDPTVFATYLREHRHLYKLSQPQMAAKLGVSLNTLRRWEHGRTSFGCLVIVLPGLDSQALDDFGQYQEE